MKALVHIGTEKTGTSTIQEFLHQNREELKNQGVAYLRSPGVRNNRKLATYCISNDRIDDHIQDLGIASGKKRNKWKADFQHEFSKEIQELDETISTVIISSEHFHSRLVTLEEIRNLFHLLAGYFDEINILVYLRRQDKVAVSLYSTWCRVGGSHETILDSSIDADDPYYNYFHLVELWATVFGKDNVIIRIFNREKFVNHDLLQDFMSACAIKPTEKLVIPELVNKKLSAQIQNAIILFNASFPYYVHDTPVHFNNQLRSYLLEKLEMRYSGKERLPTKKKAVAFYEKFSDSNKNLAQKYFSGQRLFSDDFTNYPDDAVKKPLSEEIVGDIFQYVSEFLDGYFLVPKDRVNTVDTNGNPRNVLKEIALIYETDYPEIYLFLMKEARAYRAIGAFFLDKFHLFVQKVYLWARRKR